MLDACPSTAMATPRPITNDAVVCVHRGDELGDNAIAAIGERTAMDDRQCFDDGASVVNDVVAVARPSSGGRDAVKSRRRTSTCALHDQR